ncbi:MAG: iron ABC transporter permease [Coriobacteriia bacterium]|nr:iron ABC transporter permease [Coriobacteriia bacterium]
MKNTVKYIVLVLLTLAVFVVCVCVGSVGLDTDIITSLRLPRVICVALLGAALSICGVAMQTLLKNPLADGSTLGVSSGASIGAVAAMILGIPFVFPFAVIAAFLSLLLILALTRRIDPGFNTNTIILVGVVFAMFASSIISLLIALFPQNALTITFWTFGSVVGVDYYKCAILAVVLCLGFIVFMARANELNIMSIGEENASHIGVNVGITKIIILVCVAVLIGVSVAIAGTIAFVGLIVPHICRFIVGANAKKLLPASLFYGSCFLMLADLLSRTIASPIELPIGVVTSVIGAVVFMFVFFRQRKK